MLHPDDPFYGDVCNDYDLFGKNDDIDMDVKTVMVHCSASNMNLTPGIAPIRKDLDLAHRMERAVYLGLDEKDITAKYVADKKIILLGRARNA